MKFTLDRVALRHLMDSDPDFELQLKGAVLSEIGKRFFEKDAARVIREASPALFDQAVALLRDDAEMQAKIDTALAQKVVTRPSWREPQRLTPEVQEAINLAVAVVKTSAVVTAEKMVRDTIATVVTERIAVLDLDDLIQKRVDRLSQEDIDRRVDAKVNERLAAMRAALT